MPENAEECQRMPKNAEECRRMPKNAEECQRMPKNTEGQGIDKKERIKATFCLLKLCLQSFFSSITHVF